MKAKDEGNQGPRLCCGQQGSMRNDIKVQKMKEMREEHCGNDMKEQKETKDDRTE